MEDKAPIVEIAEAIVATVANPGVATILADIQLAQRLSTELKAKMKDADPSLIDFFKALFE